MEFFNIILEVIQKEIERFNLNESVYIAHISKLTSTLSENFDVPYNRCAYMYRYATCNINFVTNCISQFLIEYPEARDLLESWRSHSDLDLCSLSCGPGLDYLSFSLAVSEWGETLDMFNTVKIVSRNAAWRNTVNFLSESLAKAQLSSIVPNNVNYQNVQVTQGDIKKGFNINMIDLLQSSEVVLMYKTLNLPAPGSEDEEANILSNLSALVSSLRPETTIFFIDTKPSVSLMQKALSETLGTYLFGPVQTPFTQPLTFPEVFKEAMGRSPTVSARGTFFVWQKAPLHLFPDLPFPPECIQAMEFEKEDWSGLSTSAELPIIGLVGRSSAKTPSTFDDAESLKNSVLLTSSIPEHISTDVSPDLPELDNTRINLSAAQEDGSDCNLQTSELSTSARSSQSDILDSLLTELLNSSPPVKTLAPNKGENFDFDENIIKISKKKFSITGSKDAGVIHGKTESSTDGRESHGCMDFPPLNLPSWNPIYVDPQQRVVMSSESKSSERLKMIRNLVYLNNISDPQFNLESKLTQTDPIFPNSNYPDSIKLLTDRINKLAVSFEKELTQEREPCGNHGTCFDRYHDCPLRAQEHCCASNNCDNQAKSLTSVDRTNQCESNDVNISDNDKPANIDKFMKCSSSGVECSHSCSSNKYCPHQVQCCHSQHIPQCCNSSGPSFVNSPINIAVPSIVIPLQNISEDIISQILADVKIGIDKRT